jgi:protein gp37
MAQQWVENIRAVCQDQNVAFFFKQWGGTHKGRNGRLLDGRTWDEYPPTVASVA